MRQTVDLCRRLRTPFRRSRLLRLHDGHGWRSKKKAGEQDPVDRPLHGGTLSDQEPHEIRVRLSAVRMSTDARPSRRIRWTLPPSPSVGRSLKAAATRWSWSRRRSITQRRGAQPSYAQHFTAVDDANNGYLSVPTTFPDSMSTKTSVSTPSLVAMISTA